LAFVVHQWQQGGGNDVNTFNRIRTHIQSILKAYGYSSVFLLDAHANVLLMQTLVSDDMPDFVSDLKNHKEIAQQTHLTEIHKTPKGKRHLALEIPLIYEKTAVGTVVFTMDHGRMLFPLLKMWPTSSKTAESILLQIEDEGFRVISGRRHKSDKPQPVFIPSRNAEYIKQILNSSGEGNMELIDRRGESVIGYLKKIPDSPWFIVTKIDQDEIYAPIHQRLPKMIFLLFLMLTLVALSLFYWWRTQQAKLIARSELQFRLVTENIQDVFWMSTVAMDEILYISPAYETLWERSREELYQSPGLLLKTIHPDDLEGYLEVMDKYHKHGKYYECEYRIIRLNGMNRWIAEKGYPVKESFDGHQLMTGMCTDITESKHAAEALMESEAQVRLLLNSTAEAIYSIDLEGCATLVNKACIQMLGFESAADIIGQNMHNLIHHSHQDGSPYPEEECFALQTLASGGSVHADNDVFWRCDGSQFTVEYWSYPIRENGVLIGCVVTFMDISQRVANEKALRESERRYQSFFNHSNDAIFIINPVEDEIIQSNSSAAKMLGYGTEELKQTPISRIHPDEMQAMSEFAKKVFTTGSAVTDRLSCITRTGEKIPAIISGAPLQINGADCILAIVHDIRFRLETERYQRQAAAVFESTAEGVMITDTRANIIQVNKAFTEITGYSLEDCLGKTPGILSSGRHDYGFFRDMWAAIGRYHNWQGEIWNRRKNGEVYPQWLTISEVYDEQDKLQNYVGVFTDISSIKHSQAELEHLAHHDPLTDLPNRILFNSLLGHLITRFKRESQRFAVLFLDLDRFKNINDSLGHPVGDGLLLEAAARIKKLIREEDTVARLGGDEFAIVLEEIKSEQDAAIVAQKICNSLSKPFSVNEHGVISTASIGIALFPDDGTDCTTLIKNADAAMYEAKQSGRNTYRFYRKEMTLSALQQLTMERSLRRALDNEELEVWYQAQIDLNSGKIVGAEALVRWRDPERGLVSPLDFIPLAEETGLVIPLGEWVLQKTCEQVVQWQAQDIYLKSIAVNVAGQQIEHSDFVAVVAQILKETGLSPEILELEITEGFIMHDAEHALEVTSELKKLGVFVAIDDFGTGYSSLAYLKRLPIDKLKIDQGFIRNLPQDTDDIAICKTVIDLAANMGCKTIAEGVETKQQAQFLKKAGCHEAQGYLYSKPVMAHEFLQLLQQKLDL
ncbi:MAG: EAL domain-containing protein, partial [gamma proteobacterium symbiont of Bathyaustriella thionipta]|nr:EAL domain-containing protein [gamma proteobacterium symbiont of Bathyaustriella thionipta]